jgi:hypothetical protein
LNWDPRRETKKQIMLERKHPARNSDVPSSPLLSGKKKKALSFRIYENHRL